MKLRIFPPEDMIDGCVELPVSKSVANRRMIIDALAGCELPRLPDDCGDDIKTLREALLAKDAQEINVGPAGTAMRFMTAWLAVQPGRVTILDGDRRMRQRPIKALVDALRSLGASIDYVGEEGFAPLRITGARLEGGSVIIDGGISSQFASALLMIAPTMRDGLKLCLDGVVKSEPYIMLTIDMMTKRGINVEYDKDSRVATVMPGAYSPDPGMPLEHDWSAMAFWTELCAITADFITVEGVDRDSAQGDRAVMDIFGELGCAESQPDDDDDDETETRELSESAIQLCGSADLTPRFIHDFSANPDLAQPAIVTCCLSGIPFKVTGLETLVHKETDRVTALIEELGKVGYVISREAAGALAWEGRRDPIATLPIFDSHDDHRMAMSLAPVAFYLPGIVIDGAECVSKSYPGYWEQLRQLGFRCIDGDINPDDLHQENEEDGI